MFLHPPVGMAHGLLITQGNGHYITSVPHRDLTEPTEWIRYCCTKYQQQHEAWPF